MTDYLTLSPLRFRRDVPATLLDCPIVRATLAEADDEGSDLLIPRKNHKYQWRAAMLATRRRKSKELQL